MSDVFVLANRELRQTSQGYRLWETTSDAGSPISPDFPTLAELCAWAAEHATIFADRRLTAAEWHQVVTSNNPATVQLV